MIVPLYVQSEYSLLQSVCPINKLVSKALDYGYKSISITDDAMYGVIKFYKACKAKGIKPLIGLKTTYVINGITSNILLYAMNNFGYINLMKIASKSKITNRALDIEDLRKYSIGILAITPGNENILYNYCLRNNLKEANMHYQILSSVFTPSYIGIFDVYENQNNIKKMVDFFSKITSSLTALSKTSFLDPKEFDAYKVLNTIRNEANISDIEQNNYLKPNDYYDELFSEFEELIINNNNIANMCNVEIEFNKIQLPSFDENISSKDYLKELCIAGLTKRSNTNSNIIENKKVYLTRLNYEYQTICEMGFADYFLIVWDYVKFAKKNHIYVGPGRGSAGASLVAYVLGITEIDPIKYNLLFERFLNKERVSMPDIDIDFPDDSRELVIKYVGEKYGKGRVAHITAFGTFQTKLAINETAKVLKLPETHLRQIIKCINNVSNKKLSLKEIISKSDELIDLASKYDDIAKTLEIASVIYGLPRNLTTHAAGIIITKYNLLNYTPLDNGLDGIYQTEYEASDLESLGLLKMDFLGLRNLTNISKTIDLIRNDNPNISLPKEENDYNVFKMLASGDVTGVFQLESAGMRKLIMDLKTSSLNDIIQALALYRPGPMDIIPLFIRRKFKLEKIEYPHQDLKEILEETYGTIVYQEQIMQIAVKFAGYSLGRADILRRAVSKKKKDVLEKERTDFVNSSMKLGYDYNTAENIYNYIVKFADYGFNKAHSVAYAKLAYITAYLKCNYPAYYISTLLTSFIGSQMDILEYCKEAMRKNIGIVAPNINISESYFSCQNNQIVFPLTIIKGLGEVKTKEIIDERSNGKFKSFKDFLVRTKKFLPLSIIENIIYSGALDCFNLTKLAMIKTAKVHIDMLDYEDIPGMKQIKYPEDEFSYGVLLEKEKEVLGINLTYNFFIQYKNLYVTKHITKIKDIVPNVNVKTLGIVKRINQIKTKNNEQMAFMVIEDNISEIELTLFPRVYNQYLDIQNGDVIIVYGNSSMRNQLQIVVDNIEKI